jgi:predicted enzyme related to lactoylglutathione lyase
MNRPTHFEIHASDPARAIQFYTTAFGWRFDRWDGPTPYWFIHTGDGPGLDGGLVQRIGADPVVGTPVTSWVNSIKVASCDAAVEAIVAGGGTIAHGRMAIPGMGWLAYGKDTEGNIFGVMQDDSEAK